MGGFRAYGPECVSKGTTRIDAGTLNRRESLPPGPTPRFSASEGYSTFRDWALREAMAISYGMDALAALNHYATISRLGGSFLRMYLRHAFDEETIQAAGQEIGKSPEFERLRFAVKEVIQSRTLDVIRRLPTGAEIAAIADQYLKKTYKEEGIAFRGPLNPVIGGIEGVKVVGASTASSSAVVGSVKMLSYVIQVNFQDKYKFLGNRRSGGKKGTVADQPTYDMVRKRWADLLSTGHYLRVRYEYDRDLLFNSQEIGRPATFASLMYAIESVGITPGPLPWNATIEMPGEVGYPT